MDNIAFAGETTLQNLIKLLTQYKTKLGEAKTANEELTAQIEVVKLELTDLKETYSPLKNEYDRLLIKTATEKINIAALDSEEITKLNLNTTNEKMLKAIEMYTNAMEVERAGVERERMEFERKVNETLDQFKIEK